MGYFPNGTAGEAYAEQYCDRCVHYQGCPVWLAHMLYNYRDCNDKSSILHLLIPRDDDKLDNGECLMFHADPDAKAGALVDQKYLDWKRQRNDAPGMPEPGEAA